MDKYELNNWPQAEEIKSLTQAKKEELAQKLRQYIIKYTARNGGHLSSNLGVVELTIALLSSCDFPTDAIIFDVGHQSYSWKILTGRAEQFKSLRKDQGLSGFPKTEESIYDSFNTGHSSTSLSAAAGMARARKLSGKQGKIIVVVGDGALSGGMAYEAINDICQQKDDITVILNDNQMSIDQVVGGLAKHLEHLRLTPSYLSLKSRWLDRLNRIPLIGGAIVRLIEGFKSFGRSIIHKRKSRSSLFEQLGFKYYGPVDGHNISQLEKYLASARKIKGPVLIHAITQKGKGYAFAEENPADYHGVAPFVIDLGLNGNGTDVKRSSWSEVFGAEILKLARENEKICAISAAMTSGTGLLSFEEHFPERFFDVGIAEQHALTLAAGLAKEGMRPFVALYSTFLQRGIDQLLHDICLQNLPVTIALDRSGAVSSDGETHQGIYDLSICLAFPNLEIFAPAFSEDLSSLLKFSLTKDNPVLIRYPKEIAPSVSSFDFTLAEDFDPYAIREFRKGEDIAIFALGAMLKPALQAADLLLADGIKLGVYSLIAASSRNIHAIMCIANSYKGMLLIEDGIYKSAWAESILADLKSKSITVNADHIGIIHPLAAQADRSILLERSGLDAAGIAEKAKTMLMNK